MFNSFTSILTWPAAWTASVWKTTPCFLQTAPISLIGCNVPISLLANIIVTNVVSSLIAFSTSSTLTTPFSGTSNNVISNPSFSNLFKVWRTPWCSIFVEIICFLFLNAPSLAAEIIAWLSASLPPDVKYISLKSAPMHLAISTLACSKTSLAFCPTLCKLDGFP